MGSRRKGRNVTLAHIYRWWKRVEQPRLRTMLGHNPEYYRALGAWRIR